MSRVKEVVTATGTLACALSIGFIMQSSEVSKHRYGVEAAEVLQDDQQELGSAASLSKAMQVENITLTSALPQSEILLPDVETTKPLVERHAELLSTPDKTMDEVRIAAPVCTSAAIATPHPGAFVNLMITADCLPNTQVTIRHGEMAFSETTDANGKLDLMVPAFSFVAKYEVEFLTGEDLFAQIAVSDLNDVRRVVLQYNSGTGFELHAREFGAEYGSDGHVWRGSDSATDALQSGSGGHLTLLGARDIPGAEIAEIYTFPAGLSPRGGEIDVSVEARVTAANCGQQIQSTSTEIDNSGYATTRSISLNVPACDAVGDYLLLNNLFEDLKIAAR